jgi:hypothetical protein
MKLISLLRLGAQLAGRHGPGGRRIVSALALGFAMAPWASAQEQPEPAELLSAPADERLAWAYRLEHGEGVAKQMGLAIRLLCTLAWDGNAEAAYELGWIYLNGRDVPKDEGRGMAWIASAVELGDPLAKRLRERLSRIEPTQADCLVPDEHGNWVPWNPNNLHEGPMAELAQTMAPRFGLDPRLVLALISVESDFNPQAVSSKGAQGLMQLMPSTASRFQVQDPFDPAQNLAGGMAYLSWLVTHFDGSLTKALAGYNAGENAVQRYGGVPPYPETQAYVREVMQRYWDSGARL